MIRNQASITASERPQAEDLSLLTKATQIFWILGSLAAL
jgi:hypothetical protein